MKTRIFLAASTVALAFSACGGTAGRRVTEFLRAGPPPLPADTRTVVAVTETPPVADAGDAADDPAIWVNMADPAASLIVATNKLRGLIVYGVDGEIVSSSDVGQVNNVDLRAGLGGDDPGETIVVAATNRSARTIDVFGLDPETGNLSPLLTTPITPGFAEEPYGLCMYRSGASGDLYVFAIDFAGAIEQWRLDGDGRNGWTGTRVRAWEIGSKTEGCVADDANGWLFIGEEEVGIWRYGAEPDMAPDRVTVDSTGVESGDGRLAASVEGVTLYAPANGDPQEGFLIASSQGNYTYVVYDRAPPHNYRGTFRVGDGPGTVDGAEDTDGLHAASAPLGPNYPMGLLVVQDGINVAPDGSEANQNFKFVSWQDVVEALNLTPRP